MTIRKGLQLAAAALLCLLVGAGGLHDAQAQSVRERLRSVISRQGEVQSRLREVKQEQAEAASALSSARRKEQEARDRATTATAALGRRVAWKEAADAVAAGFAEALNLHLAPGALTPEERAWAEELQVERYTTDGWTFRI